MKLVFKGFLKEVFEVKQQRMINEEHTRIQKQINEFLERMKATESETSESIPQIQELNAIQECSKESLTESQFEQSKESINSGKPEISPIVNEVSIQTEVMDVSQSVITVKRASTEEPSSKNLKSNNETNVKMPKAKPKASKIILEMEDRERKRKEKREQLKKVYEDKRKAKELERVEEERKRLEEEKKQKIEEKEKRKREKLLKKRQEEAKAKLQEEIARAISHHNRILYKIAFKGFRYNIEYGTNEKIKATEHYNKTLKRVKYKYRSRNI